MPGRIPPGRGPNGALRSASSVVAVLAVVARPPRACAGAALTPYRRFSALVALAVAVGSVVLSLAIARVIERYVAEETATQTAREVADHYPSIFGPTIFQQPLSPDEQTRFNRTVRFHLDIYDIVQVRMYKPDGTIVYSYDPAAVGGSAFEGPGAERARGAARGERAYDVGGDGIDTGMRSGSRSCATAA